MAGTWMLVLALFLHAVDGVQLRSHRLRLEGHSPDNVRGQLEIIFLCEEDADRLTLQAHPSVIITDAVLEEAVPVSWVQSHPEPLRLRDVRRLNESTLLLNLQRPCQPNRLYKAILNYSLEPHLNVSFGYYMIKDYAHLSGNYKWYHFASMITTGTPNLFPFLGDKFRSRTPFQLELVRSSKFGSLSNAALRTSTNLGGKEHPLYLDSYFSTLRLPSFLLALVVEDYIDRTSTLRPGLTVALWRKKELELQTDTFFRKLVRAVEFMEQMLGVPCPLQKLDVVLQPQMPLPRLPPGWAGLMILPERAALWSGTRLDAERLDRLASRLAAMVWFGGLTSASDQRGQWFNSGITGYLEFVGAAVLSPLALMDTKFVVGPLHMALSMDDSSWDAPVVRSLEAKSMEILTIEKAASILRMMKYAMGTYEFKLAMKNYLCTVLMHSSSLGSFFSFLEMAEKGIGVALKSWVQQSGYPLIRISRQGPSGKIVVTQQPWPRGSPKDSRIWHVPITITNGKSLDWYPDVVTWLRQKKKVLDDKPPHNDTWVLANVRQMGFFRVTYDLDNWERIIRYLHLRPGNIHVANRAQILDDLFELARVGHVPYDLPLRASLYLTQEDDFVPIRAFISNIAKLDQLLESADSGVYANWQKYCSYILEPIFNTVKTWKVLEIHNLETEKVEELVVTALCYFNHSGCLNLMASTFEKAAAEEGGFYKVPPGIRTALYCTALRIEQSSSAARTLEDRLIYEKDPSERLRLIAGLACANK